MAAMTAVLYREARIRFTNAVWVLWDVFHPLFYLLVFGVGMDATMAVPLPAMGGASYNSFFLGGVLCLASFGIASNSSWGFFVDRDNGIFFEMLTYPLSRAQFLLGKMLFNLVLGVVQAVITVGLAWWLLDVPVRREGLPLLSLLVAGGTAAWFYFYAIFSLRIRRNDVYNSVNSLFYFYFLFASSMFYPLEPLPAWFRWVALANPVTWHVDLLRYATIGAGEPRLLVWEAAGFTLFSVASFWCAVRALQKQE